MTKAERLIYLVNMIKNRGSVFVRDMAMECGVSDRTIYRDLNSLSRMNIPIYYQNGYRLVRDTSVPFMDLSHDDMELIRYSLRSNPLFTNSFFKTKFRMIEQKILEKEKVGLTAVNKDLFIFDKRVEATEKSRGSEILSRYLMAIFENRKIKIKTSGDEGFSTYIPVAIRIEQSKPELVLTDDNRRSTVEMPVEVIEDLKLADEKFGQRPTELLNSLGVGKRVDVA
jgi:hypothetical protein